MRIPISKSVLLTTHPLRSGVCLPDALKIVLAKISSDNFISIFILLDFSEACDTLPFLLETLSLVSMAQLLW